MVNQHEVAGGLAGALPARPPSYLARSLILALLVIPLGLLIAASKLVETINILYHPHISETPVWMGALMAIMAGVAGLLGLFAPIASLTKSLQVTSRFNAGNYAGAESASKRAANYSKQSIIFLIALSLIILTDLFSFLAS
ncbi:MAG: CD225/dispanin family protein [Pyrinomonadaceae bacterium]|nr:CD225/dispanin family protein [Pyrinomonadaceae bacterium]